MNSPANGVPWFHWEGRRDWQCDGCGGHGRLHASLDTNAFVLAIKALKEAHSECSLDRRPVIAPSTTNGTN